MNDYVTFTRAEDGGLRFWMGRHSKRAVLATFDWKSRAFQFQEILGSVHLPRKMTIDQAMRWANKNFALLHKRLPTIEEFR